MNTLKAKNQSITAEKLNALIIDAIQDIKGIDIVSIDLRRLDEAPADFFIICHGSSTTQTSAIADNVVKKVKEKLGDDPQHVEGMRNSRWVLVDYFTVVVHVFYRELREFYHLEELWGDGLVKKYE